MMRLVALIPVAPALFGACLASLQDPAQKVAKPDPQAKVGLSINDPKAFQGYTLFCPLSSNQAYLIDMTGRVVHTWEGAATPASSAYLLANGNLLRPCVLVDNKGKGGGGPDGGRIQEFTWEGDLVWDFQIANDQQLSHHGVHKLPNGNLLVIVGEMKSAAEAADAGRKTVANMRADTIVEIRPTGKTTAEVVWEWHMWDHLIQDFDNAKAHFGDVAAHPELIDINAGPGSGAKAPKAGAPPGKGALDWTHTNAVDYNPALDQILISVCNFSELWILDHSTTTAEAAGHAGGKSGKGGDILYRWGNPRAYRAGTAAEQRLFAQHNPHWIPRGLPGEGHILVFNNGINRPGGNFSQVDELVPPVDAKGRYALQPGSAFGPEKPLWSYAAPDKSDFYSSYISGAQRLPNGNTLICSGADGIFFEVTADKEMVWKYVNPVRAGADGKKGGAPTPGAVFRAYRYPSDYRGLVGRDLKATRTIEELLPLKKQTMPMLR
jgi:Arylsulfotransferase (ASST)